MSFLDSSSVVAKPFTSFCLATGGGVGGREAGGVGGLLRLFCGGGGIKTELYIYVCIAKAGVTAVVVLL